MNVNTPVVSFILRTGIEAGRKTMNNYSIGDKVVCNTVNMVASYGEFNVCGLDDIRKGDELTISHIRPDGFIKFDGHKYYHCPDYFKPIWMETDPDKNGPAPPDVLNSYDFVNPQHYQVFSIEVIDMMVSIWGKEAVSKHCEMCAFKYRMRAGGKPDQPIERDLEKAKWYENKARELRS